MLRTNEDKLIKISVAGEVSHPTISKAGYNICADGSLTVVPGVGGITYNKRIGDSCVGLAADHVEPGVSVRQPMKNSDRANAALNTLSCIGNTAKVISGDARGAEGYVTGKHGGIEHVLVDFPHETLEKLAIGDRIQITAYGAGFELLDFPGIKLMNIDPRILKILDPQPIENGRLEVRVALIVPAAIMGSGLGANTCHSGDYDIQMFDPESVRKYGLAQLRFGDIIAIMNADHSYGRIYKSGAISIGVVVHSDSKVSGHGPGVTTLMTSPRGMIVPRIFARANLANMIRHKKTEQKKKKPLK